MQFKDVIGQDAVKLQLAEMVHQNRLSHALLFLGKEGTGALPMALAFAQFITCATISNSPNQEAKAAATSSLFGEEEVTAPTIVIDKKISPIHVVNARLVSVHNR